MCRQYLTARIVPLKQQHGQTQAEQLAQTVLENGKSAVERAFRRSWPAATKDFLATWPTKTICSVVVMEAVSGPAGMAQLYHARPSDAT